MPGTGKTTCIKFLVDYLLNNGITEEQIIFTSFTGKAVQVMIDKGNTNALTLHKLLYKSKPLPNGKFIHVPVPIGELPYRIIICDEVSMVSKDIIDRLLTHHIYTVFIGDNAQLPPIRKEDDNHLLDHPHAMLTTIHRQAADSGIIQLSMLIREGKKIDGFQSGDALVIPKSKFTTGCLSWADQILCATNATRKNLNTQCRQLRGYTQPLEEGEKIIALRNDWECISESGAALTNGCIGTLTDFFETYIQYPQMFKVKGNKLPIIHGHFTTETGEDFGELDMDKQCLLTGETYLDSKQKYAIGRNRKYMGTLPNEFTYGYAITGHKSQGSEWAKVLAIEESFPFVKEEHQRWLYTACTRASEKLVLVR